MVDIQVKRQTGMVEVSELRQLQERVVELEHRVVKLDQDRATKRMKFDDTVEGFAPAMKVLHSLLWKKGKAMRDSLFESVDCSLPTLKTMIDVEESGDTTTPTPVTPRKFTKLTRTSQEKKMLVMPSRAVVGSPGIGKSVFLVYVLIERLLAGKPTALQFEPDGYYYFNVSGVKFYAQAVECPSSYENPTWALADSNEDVAIPCVGFRRSSFAVIVQATSPRVARYKSWVKHREVNNGIYYMNNWTWEEIAYYGCEVRRLNMKELWEFWKDWNPCPRYCFKHACSRELMAEYEDDLKLVISKEVAAIIEEWEHMPSLSSQLVLMSVVETSDDQDEYRVRYKMTIIGERVRQLLLDRLDKYSDAERKRFYRMLGVVI
ncbi:hypothetical protein SeLEV6574_g02414 [Synchytrium endobioticum]|uniref:Uncharacterized protein n=1 Tax=Synchytrium endobioticum TaxID=286115 RepID=A0A507D8U8_9FUNG|nr:hypothetical protein SeLEV6574_g02414 [Synchytrium endobioticum]